MSDHWPGEVWSGLLEVRERLLAVIPGLLVMLTLVALGLLAAWVARLAVSSSRASRSPRTAEASSFLPAITAPAKSRKVRSAMRTS